MYCWTGCPFCGENRKNKSLKGHQLVWWDGRVLVGMGSSCGIEPGAPKESHLVEATAPAFGAQAKRAVAWGGASEMKAEGMEEPPGQRMRFAFGVFRRVPFSWRWSRNIFWACGL